MIAFIVTLALTLYMSGMIWSMQVLEYPLFALVGPKEFPAYHRRHNRGLPLLVILPSLAAFVSAVVVIFTRPARFPLWASIAVAVLDLLIIIATVVREAPLHSPTCAGQLDSRRALDGQCHLVAGVDGAVAFGGELETARVPLNK